VTLSHKCCRGTVHKSLSQVGHWSNASYTAAAAAAAQLGLCSVVLKRRTEQQRLQIAPNVRYDDRDLTDVGIEFQARAAATGNARSPSVARRDDGTIRYSNLMKKSSRIIIKSY